LVSLDAKKLEKIDKIFELIFDALNYLKDHSYYETLMKYSLLSSISENIFVLEDIYNEILVQKTNKQIDEVVEKYS
jgi:hypothetical protein